MLKEFKEFISKGNIMDMAVGVIIGGAFTSIVNALTSCFIKPILGLIGGAEVKGTIPLGHSGQALDYGTFLTAVINFLIVAFVLFIILRTINTANEKSKEKLEKIAEKVNKKVKLNRKGKSKNAEPEVKVAPEPATKICPYCLSEINYKAVRCPHCTSELGEHKEETVKE